jgi:hypothetical protein
MVSSDTHAPASRSVLGSGGVQPFGGSLPVARTCSIRRSRLSFTLTKRRGNRLFAFLQCRRRNLKPAAGGCLDLRDDQHINWYPVHQQPLNPSNEAATATAGLNAPPETEPTATACTKTAKPIASPSKEFPAVAGAVATFRKVYTRANAPRNSASST